jgi:hypothetical protein
MVVGIMTRFVIVMKVQALALVKSLADLMQGVSGGILMQGVN